MFRYKDERGEIGIDLDRGTINKLQKANKAMTADAKLPVFSLRLRKPDGKTAEYSAFDCKLRSRETTKASVSAVYTCDAFDAELHVSFGGSNWSVWRIAVTNHTNAAIEWVDYPQIPLAKENGVRKASFYWPYNEGVQIDDIDLREKSGWGSCETEFPGMGKYALFPGMVESQFVAYELDGGLYLGAHDEERGLKNIDIVSDKDYARLKMRIYTGTEFGADWQADYDVVADLFDGGWMSAAEIYRRWLDCHTPSGLKKIAENTALPEWYGDSPVVVTYPVRGLHDMDRMEPNRLFPYENVLPRIEELARKMNCRIMVLLMHWEGTAPWAPPFVWPPYGGEKMLRNFIEKLHAKGHLLGVYLSGIGFTVQSNLIAKYNCEELLAQKGYRRDLCISPEGELLPSKICTGQRSGYDLCPTGQDTADIVCGEVGKMAEAGIDYAQILDQNHGGNPYFCYSREHGHAPVPGPWMTRSMQQLLKRAAAAGGNMLFGCESAAGEPYLPYLLMSDCRFNLSWMYGRPVPMFAYLYHEYLHNFMGNQVCAGSTFRPDPESLAYRLAYSFTAGDLPTLILTDDGRLMQAWGDRQFDILPDEEHTLALVGNMIALRRGAGKKYLCGGRMCRPLPVTGCGTHCFALDAMDGKLDADTILTSRWQAADGSEAQILVNWTKRDISCKVGFQTVLVPAASAILLENEVNS